MKKIIALAILLLSLKGVGQQEMMISQYMFNGLFLNPAYTGSHKFTEVTALHRQQWVGYAGAPVSQILTADAHVKNTKVGWGAILTNDRIGVTYKTDLYGNYAYHLPVSAKGRLSFGVRGGCSYYRALLTQLTVWDGQDQVFSNNIKSRILPNAGAGIYYYTHNMFAGFSAPNMVNYEPSSFASTQNFVKEPPHFVRHMYLYSGYVFEVNENLHIKPNVLVKYVKNAPIEADFNLNVLINRSFWVGASYRTGDGIVGIIEYQHNNTWRIGYSYDYAFTLMRQYSYGSHEIMFSYMFVRPEIDQKIKNPRFF